MENGKIENWKISKKEKIIKIILIFLYYVIFFQFSIFPF